MSYPSNQPWDQDRYQFEPPRSSSGVLIIVLVVFLGLGIVFVGGAAALFIAVQRGALFDVTVKVPPELDTAEPAHEVDWRGVRQGFSQASVGGAQRLARVERLLAEFLRCGNEGDQDGLRKVVDYSRFEREMRKTRFQPVVDDYDRDAISRDLTDSLRAISGWNRLNVVRIDKLSQFGEILVYAHAYQSNGYSNPVRIWIVDRGQPRIFDWEMTEYGSRESGDYAVYYAYSNEPCIDEYYAALTKISDSDSQRSAGETEKARALLAEAAQADAPPSLQDQLLLQVAYRSFHWADRAAAQACIDRVQSPQQTPGVYLIAAQLHRDAGNRDAAQAALDAFEAIVGITPQSLMVRAECLQREQRWDEATAQYERLLRLLPEEPSVLQAWGSALRDDEKSRLVAHVQSLRNPKAIASQLAQHFSMYNDVETALAVGELLRDDPRHAPQLKYVQAEAKEANSDYAGAAKLYQEVVRETNDAALRKRAQWSWYDAMMMDDKLLAAYAASDDANEAFMHFVSGYQDDESWVNSKQLAEIVAAHRIRQPNDPWGLYYASIVAAEAERDDEAIQLAREGLAKLETRKETAVDVARDDEENEEAYDDTDYLRELLQRQLLATMCESGRALEAYETIPPTDDMFVTVGDLLAENKRHLAQLVLLVAARTAAQPNDARLPYYRAVIARLEGQFDVADRLIAEAMASSVVQGDEGLAASYRSLWLTVHKDAQRYTEALSAISPIDDTLQSLAWPLHIEQDWAKLSELLDAYAAQRGESVPRYIYWRAKLLIGTDDDAALAELLTPWPAEKVFETWETDNVRMELVDALLKLDRQPEALRIAAQIRDEGGSLLPLVLCHFAAGDRQQAETVLWQSLAQGEQTCYHSAQLHDEVWSKEFAPLRREYPPYLSSGYSTGDAVVLLAKPNFNLAAAERLVQAVSPAAKTIALPIDENETASAVSVRTADWQAVICWGEDRYQQDDADVLADLEGPLRDAWKSHAGWVSIEVVEPKSVKAKQVADQFAAALSTTDDAVAVWARNHLLLAGDATAALLRGDHVGQAVRQAGTSIWIYREAEEKKEKNRWNQRLSLRELDRRFQARKDGEEFFVKCKIDVGNAGETQWLKLVRVNRPGHRDREFVCEFVSDAVLSPRFAAGEHARLPTYRIHDWKIVAGDQVTFGRAVK